MTWQEFSIWFSDNVKPALESFFIGLIATVTYEFGNYVMAGGDLSYRALLVFVVSSGGNYITSKLRRTNAKELKTDLHEMREKLQQAGLANEVLTKNATAGK